MRLFRLGLQGIALVFTLVLMVVGAPSMAFSTAPSPAAVLRVVSNPRGGPDPVRSTAPGTTPYQACFTVDNPTGKIGCGSALVTAFYSHGDGFAAASGIGDSGADFQTASIVDWYVLLTGPRNQSIQMTATISTSISVSNTGAGYTEASASARVLDSLGNTLLQLSDCLNSDPVVGQSFGCNTPAANNQMFKMILNTGPAGFATYALEVSAGGYTHSLYFPLTGQSSSGSYAATADPFLTFAPGVDSTGFTLTFSPDLPVPEPATGLLVMTGVLGLAMSRRAGVGA